MLVIRGAYIRGGLIFGILLYFHNDDILQVFYNKCLNFMICIPTIALSPRSMSWVRPEIRLVLAF